MIYEIRLPMSEFQFKKGNNLEVYCWQKIKNRNSIIRKS